mgnify:CR=1 FL=1
MGAGLSVLVALLVACGEGSEFAEPTVATGSIAATTSVASASTSPPSTTEAPVESSTSPPSTTEAPTATYVDASTTTEAPATTEMTTSGEDGFVEVGPEETTSAVVPPTTTHEPVPTATVVSESPGSGDSDPQYVAAVEAFVANADSDWGSAPYLGDCMIRNGYRLSAVARQLVVANGLIEALPFIGGLGGDGISFFVVWDECGIEAEGLLASTANSSAPTVSCQGALATLPIDRQSIMGVVPLGHLNPPAHTQTTDHVYLLIPGWAEQISPSVNIVAPAKGAVVKLASFTSDHTGVTFTDWQVEISVCAGGTIRFGHVSTISDDLLALTEVTPTSCETYGYVGFMTEECKWMDGIGFPLSEGDLIGTAGGLNTPNTGLDFWAYDWEGEPHFAIDPTAQPGGILRAQCPLDWFSDDLRTELYSQRMERGILADEETGCGKVFQDVVGTAKGFWYSVAPIEGKWLNHLALVDDNVRSDHQAISVAALVADPGYWIFQKRSTGTVNRDFAQVTAGSGIHCYNTFTADSNGPRGTTDRFLIEVVDEDTLRIEHQGGICGASLSFSNPYEYSRFEN